MAHQKIALAHRGAGDLSSALHFITVARSTATTDAPMQKVRLDTAHGHILLTDPATRDEGLHVLDKAATMAARFGLSHQLASVENIKAMSTKPSGPASR